MDLAAKLLRDTMKMPASRTGNKLTDAMMDYAYVAWYIEFFAHARDPMRLAVKAALKVWNTKEKNHA